MKDKNCTNTNLGQICFPSEEEQARADAGKKKS
jgi:hypothetical protein